ncbi:kinase-regulated stress-responsive transcription factor skn7 [Entomophthora muscae]|uniref:Kinase-regulated stress-responsive transcription factor skn7 n=2 Tax=Entomophthora muscae TaxID=34485 RepID=A0ACC2U7U8_9FUNG|nr:kinase-regulated stress-responsive transcription factor skn7 [Entomophthora muscae]KAJ9082938.1 kinase-regulated stress-responsive transcription factor skn7 [Entomophthora muscae]
MDDTLSPINPVASGPTDFIQKLFRMINDPHSSTLTQWSEAGDTFIIFDPHDFAKLLLPRHFKHNNFQSFIRQLNKYGFSKVKRANDDKLWEFKHDHFSRNGVDLLKEIKRKAASTRRVSVNSLDNGVLDSYGETPPPHALTPVSSTNTESLLRACLEKVNRLEKRLNAPSPMINKRLERMMGEVSSLHKVMMAQDELMQTIVQCIVSQEKALLLSVDPQVRREYAPPVVNQNTNTVHQPQFSANIQRLVQTYKQVSKASGEILNSFSQAAQELHPCITPTSEPQAQTQPQNQSQGGFSFSMPNAFNQIAAATAPPAAQELAVQQDFSYPLKTFPKEGVPARKRPKVKGESASLPWTWIVPPNVLLVDDDPTCQAIYARSLQILGCSYEIAADGVEAVKKMQSRKYDMVLMDIWMPEMDGLSATKRIREFDRDTPIIAITGDYREADRDFYLEQGINEVLGKPLRVGELGPIMQKHWLKFCITRDSEPAQDFSQLQYSNQLPPQNPPHLQAPFFPSSASHS